MWRRCATAPQSSSAHRAHPAEHEFVANKFATQQGGCVRPVASLSKRLYGTIRKDFIRSTRQETMPQRMSLPICTFSCRLCFAPSPHLVAQPLGRGHARMTTQLPVSKLTQFARILTLPARKKSPRRILLRGVGLTISSPPVRFEPRNGAEPARLLPYSRPNRRSLSDALRGFALPLRGLNQSLPATRTTLREW